ncbi:GntR family transcriptional regulator [Halobacillus salinus]|uniref:GntR family transcriptional regulator n=1 Tax=Halobacillus salinus TaxID=192814 RepID=A0A4Z0H1E2_9BACI|nr:GntR family transcriptional regulator [Halobacillus salinus]TGB03940.1 GntR family transcriptional regulator [Halobacillus salinus]
MPTPVKDRPSMTETVYQKLKRTILLREVAPGTQLVEQTIGKDMKVSRTPIRNAMNKLKEEGLVQIIPNRGAFVVEPTTEEIKQAFHMRRQLERMTVEMVCYTLPEEEIEKLESWIEHEKETYNTRDILTYIEVNKQFHMTLAYQTNHPFLIEFTERMLDQINVYLMLYDVFYDENLDEKKRFKEHEWIVEGLRNRDLARLQQLVDQHMEESLTYMGIDLSLPSIPSTLKDDQKSL